MGAMKNTKNTVKEERMEESTKLHRHCQQCGSVGCCPQIWTASAFHLSVRKLAEFCVLPSCPFHDVFSLSNEFHYGFSGVKDNRVLAET